MNIVALHDEIGCTADVNIGPRVEISKLEKEGVYSKPQTVIIKNPSGEKLLIELDHEGFSVTYTGLYGSNSHNRNGWNNPPLILQDGNMSIKVEPTIESVTDVHQ